jgi:hypothetical protein
MVQGLGFRVQGGERTYLSLAASWQVADEPWRLVHDYGDLSPNVLCADFGFMFRV